MPPTDYRQLASALLYLLGATVAVFVTGRQDVPAMAAVVAGAGLGMVAGRPSGSPGWWPALAALLFAVAAALALLPAGEYLPAWRAGTPAAVPLAASFAAMPAQQLFWWLALAGTIVAAWFLLASPLDVRALRVFLHAVAGIVAAYAIVSIVQTQTAWTFPFSGGANFGLLPNRNHTASLLVVGSIVSFGLMQWEAVHHHRAGAALAALWGAPSLAALLFFSTSRAGVVFLALGFVLWAAGAAGQAVKRRTALVAAVILTVFLAVLLLTGGSTVRDRLGALWRASLDSGEGDSRPVDFRQPVFLDTWKMINDAPLTGQGLGHFEFVFPHYRDASLTAARVLHPESDWLMVAAESGLPALLALLVLAGWYLARCWHARRESSGLLRWTVASAIAAVLAHGVVDVPWHRPALGWFLLVVALASVPPGAGPLRWPKLWRSGQLLFGLLLLTTAVWLGRAGATERPPLAYRWPGYAAELKSLLEARKYDDGEFVAREAIRDFPLNHQAYYWRTGFLRMFEGTDREMQADTAAGRFVEPVLPSVAAEQALLWEGISDDQVVEARAEAVRRAGLIDRRTGGGSAASQLDQALQAMQGRPAMQNALRERVAADPVILAHWLRRADASLVEEYFAGLGPGVDGLLDRLPADARMAVLERWITLPSAPAAAAFMEARSVPSPGPYWRQLANYYAKAGDKPRAVAMVAGAEGFSLQGGLPPGDLARQLADLQAQGNSVAVRRLVREAAEAGQPDPDNLQLAVIWYAGSGDWEMAWKAASRLATTRKKGQ
jgi:O-antigen ligase